jgi:hypothetical protein
MNSGVDLLTFGREVLIELEWRAGNGFTINTRVKVCAWPEKVELLAKWIKALQIRSPRKFSALVRYPLLSLVFKLLKKASNSSNKVLNANLGHPARIQIH